MRAIETSLCVVSFAWSIPACPHCEAGLISGWVIPHGDFGYYWASSPAGGFSITYPFHRNLPVAFSLLASRHDPKRPQQPVRANYYVPNAYVALFNFKLTAAYRLVQKRMISPVTLLGVNCNTFIAYTDGINLAEYLGETELGMHAGAGIEGVLNDRLRVRIAYTEEIVFSRPHAIRFGTLCFELSFFLKFMDGFTPL
jgi:hypothetical protein